jgi:UPF0755 protein
MQKRWQTLGAFILIGVALWFAFVYASFLDTPIVPVKGQSFDYVLKRGSSIKTLAYDLHSFGFLKKPDLLIILAYVQGTVGKLQAGEYHFPPGIKPAQLLEQIAAGKVYYHKLRLIEGTTFAQFILVLENNPWLLHTLHGLSLVTIMEKLGLPPRNPEGLFFPATYYFTKDTTDAEILETAYQTMSEQLMHQWQSRASNLPYKTPYDTLIAASLIEKETNLGSERPQVAGVLVRRLEKNMRLQIDSTVIYGLGAAYTGSLHRTDLSEDTPYNTYLHKGLPPTPIAMPSLQSITAALHPAAGDSLYFVAKGSSGHQFSATLTAHNQAVNNYQINWQYPKIGKRFNTRPCHYFWYLSSKLQNLFPNHCQGH